jgi:hypothetical protein
MMKAKTIAKNALERLMAIEVTALATRVPDKYTGIPGVVVWVSEKEATHGRHGPRIKVSNVPNRFDTKDNFTLTFNGEVRGKAKIPGRDIQLLKQWIHLNMEPLLEYWNDGNMDPVEFFGKLKHV